MHEVIFRRLKIATAILVCGGTAAAVAQDVSPWSGEGHATTRLIAGATVTSGDAAWARAGIEIRLDPGWKTFWRYPGDSGVPPTLDFAGSENVKSVTALWPAPQRFADGAGGYSIGYAGHVVFPLRILPDDASKPSLLRVKLDYAVCGKLCVPAQAELGLMLSGKAGTEETALVTAETRVPRRTTLGAGTGRAGGLCIMSLHRDATGARERVVVTVAAPGSETVDLFVEGPTPDWALPLAVPAGPAGAGAAGMRRFTFDLDGLPPGTHGEGAMLTLTAVSPTDAVEVKARLD